MVDLSRLRTPTFVVVIGLVLFVFGPASRRARAGEDVTKFAKWEKTIAAFEAADQKQAPVKNGVVFVGSCSIRMWDVKQSSPDLPVINRGFGGS